jgi:hypothetical protein
MADMKLNGAVLINTGAKKQIVINIVENQGETPAYEIAGLMGFTPADNAMLMHEVIMHLLNVVSDTNKTLGNAHYNMICMMAMNNAVDRVPV